MRLVLIIAEPLRQIWKPYVLAVLAAVAVAVVVALLGAAS